MNKENTEKLFKDFPLLYGDHSKPMTHTLMCFGFDCGNGWYDLIYELSSKLEPLIKEHIKELEKTKELYCSYCSCPKHYHLGSAIFNVGKCLHIHKFPLYLESPKKLKSFYPSCPKIFSVNSIMSKIWYRVLLKPIDLYNWFVQKYYQVLGFFKYRLSLCHCEKFELDYPKAVQVKEKFGGLRFYMNYSSEEMNQLIANYSAKSTHICEECGNPGTLITDRSWIRTLCTKHQN